jgi:hypothetical protein
MENDRSLYEVLKRKFSDNSLVYSRNLLQLIDKTQHLIEKQNNKKKLIFVAINRVTPSPKNTITVIEKSNISLANKE